MKKASVVIGAVSLALAASAARDIVWQGAESANWSGKNWFIDAPGSNWVAGNNAVFTNAAPVGGVVVDANVSAVEVRVANTDFGFTGTGILSLNGPFAVGAGLTATVANPIGSDGNFKKTDVGELVVNGSPTTENTLKRLNMMDGTLRLDGGTYTLTATDTGASTGVVSFHANGGKLIVEGGAKVVATGPGYKANSGTEMIVTNAMVDFTSSGKGEYLHGFADFYGSTTSKVSSLTIKDKGTFAAYNYRLGKVAKSTYAAYGGKYALTTIEKGGTLVVRHFSMDGSGSSYCAGLDFNGGTLVVTNFAATEATWAATSLGGNWSNVVIRVLEGGGKIILAGPRQYQTLKCPFVSGAEEDGGLTIQGGDHFLYMEAKNSFNGGTHLRGTTFIPSGGDLAFGAVPSAPKPNIFFDTSSSILHMTTMTVDKNRTVQIGTNQTAKIGVQSGDVARIAGVIQGYGADGHLGGLDVVNNWSGCLAIGPEDGRTNQIGRLRVYSHLRHVAGTTLITSNMVQKTAANSHFYLCGNGSSFTETKGTLDIAGGLVKVTRGSWIETSSCGQLIVTNGTFDCSATSEFLNALGSGGRVIVGENGTMICNQLRITQDSGKIDGVPRSYVHLRKGGVLKTTKFWIDSGNTASVGSVLLDGGTLMPRGPTVNFLGETNSDKQRDLWNANIFVRSCAGGAVFDTDGFSISVKNPILSGAAADGGVVKKGLGTLTLVSTNRYNGVTRVDGGKLVFEHANGFPGGDLEVSAKALKDNPRTGELISAVNLAFRSGAKVRIVDTDEVGFKDFGKKVVLAKTTNAITTVPPLVVVDGEGQEQSAAGWELRLSADRKTLTFGAERGLTVFLR